MDLLENIFRAGHLDESFEEAQEYMASEERDTNFNESLQSLAYWLLSVAMLIRLVFFLLSFIWPRLCRMAMFIEIIVVMSQAAVPIQPLI